MWGKKHGIAWFFGGLNGIAPNQHRKIGSETVEQGDDGVVLLRIEMAVAVKNLVNGRMAKAAGDGLGHDSVIDEERCMRVPEIVNPDVREIGCLSSGSVGLLDAGVRDRRRAAADIPLICPGRILALVG